MVVLTINGEEYSFPHPITVSELVRSFNLAKKKIALELNGVVVPRSQFSRICLQNSDKIEIITAVGGG